VSIAKARVSPRGFREAYSCVAPVSTGARMTLIDRVLAERVGVEYRGRVLNPTSISGQVLRALEAVVPVLRVEDEELKYEAVAVISIPEDVKRVLRQSRLDENIVIGLLTLERAGIVPEPCGNYEAIGSASGYVLTLLQEFYDEDIDIEKGLELCVYCIYQAMKVSRDIGEPIQLGVATEEGARILEEEEVNKLIESVHRKEKLLRSIWGVISRDLKAQDELEKWVQEKLTALTKSSSVQESQQGA
jgi:hypothetical protein